MSARTAPRVFSIAPGTAFLPTLAGSLLDGTLVPGFRYSGDPLSLADVSIFVPTRRAARELRGIFVDRLGGEAAILPSIRPLGEFDEEAMLLDAAAPDSMERPPPLSALERMLMLAPLVRAWKSRLPAHVAALFEEEVVVPASSADSLWLARDLGRLMDEIETEGADWTKLSELVTGELAGWWQVTLDFLRIVTEHWPAILAEKDRSDPAAWRNLSIDAEAARLLAQPPAGPVIAAGSTGSIPATARLLAAVSRLPNGAVVLPGLDKRLDAETWRVIGEPTAAPSVFGHPQFGLKRLIETIGVSRADVAEIGAPEPALGARAALVSEALRPAETTEAWAENRAEIEGFVAAGALDDLALVEAGNEREEAVAIAIALRLALEEKDEVRAALVTADRGLARRVSSELLRFGIRADDSGGSPLSAAPAAVLLRLLLETAFRPGDPVALLSLLKHPLLQLGRDRQEARRAAEVLELVALRGGTGRPDICSVAQDFEARLTARRAAKRPPFWLARLDAQAIAQARSLAVALAHAVEPLQALREAPELGLGEVLKASVEALEALARSPEAGVAELYTGNAGEAFAAFLRALLGAENDLAFAADEWPDVFAALIAGEVVKPPMGADPRVAILGALEARLQHFDLLVVGGLNEGGWPRPAQADRFMSRIMKAGISLDPPERRIGLAAHDFVMAMGTERLVLTRAARAGDAPAVASRWLQRLLTCVGAPATQAMRTKGDELLAWARRIDEGPRVPPAARPQPKPPLAARPRKFSVTEIETLRRDPYAIYARRVLRLEPLEPLLRDPGAAERGTLFHDILHRFCEAGIDPAAGDAVPRFLEIAEKLVAEAALPPDVEHVWWPRIRAMASEIIAWERGRAGSILSRHAEASASATPIGATGVTLSGRADRIDLMPAKMADIVDYKTGSSPSLAQAHTLVAPQLALEAALLRRGAFQTLGSAEPADLVYVRLRPNGEVEQQSILEHKGQARGASDLAEDAWRRLEALVTHYASPATGYLSRALPLRQEATDGDYDHFARVLEWAAGGEAGEGVE